MLSVRFYLRVGHIEIVNFQHWLHGGIHPGLGYIGAGDELHLGGDDGVNQGTEEKQSQEASDDQTDAIEETPDQQTLLSL